MIARRKQLLASQDNGSLALSNAKASDNHVALPASLSLPESSYRDGSMPLPSGWSQSLNSKNSSTFHVVAPNGMPAGNAALSVVAVASANANPPINREQKQAFGSVSFSELRRTVIDRMMSAGGWVVNDREREIGGHRVFEVIAQTPGSTSGTSDQIWTFYFTEINGRVYSLSTRAAGDFTGKLNADAEKFLSSFRPITSPSGVNK